MKKCIYTLIGLYLSSNAAMVSAQNLEEIVVTATKRQESLQSVPVSVAAMTGETLDDVGVVDIEDVALYVPNFEASISTILPNIYVRGLGTGTSHSIEQPVGRFVDDVYIGRGAASILSFMDTAAVEVLRGPQGTLFGKNTMAGAMIIRTGEPTDEFEGNFDASFGSYDTMGNFGEISGAISGPLAEGVRGRVAVRYSDSDAYIKNRLSGPDGGTQEDFGIRLKLEADLTDKTTLGFKVEHGELETEGNTAIRLVGPPETSPGLVNVFQAASPGWTEGLDWTTDYVCAPDGPIVGTRPLQGFCPERDQEVQATALRIAHDFEAGEFLSITAYQTYEFQDKFYAIDMGILGGAYAAYRDEDFESITQEFRFTSEVGDTSDYIIGVYLEETDLTRNSPTDIDVNGLLGPIALQQVEFFDQDTSTLAVFGQYRYRFSDRMMMSLGGRWTTEEKDYFFERYYQPYGTDYNVRNVLPSPGPFGPLGSPVERPNENRDESRFTPSLSLQYDLDDNVMVYATLSQGYKAGGFSDRVDAADSEIEFDAEINDSIEIGLKGLYLDGAMELNVALFHMQIEDLQVSSSVPETVSFQVQNAADAISQGIEIDGRWSVTDNLLLGGNFAYLDATYDSFPDAPCTPEQASVAGASCTQDLKDQPLIFAPEIKGTIFAEYSTALADWQMKLRADATYSDEYYTETPLAPGTFQDSYEIFNAAVWFTHPNEQLRLGVIGRNLGNEVYKQFGLASPGSSFYLAEPNQPRRYSVALQYNF